MSLSGPSAIDPALAMFLAAPTWWPFDHGFRRSFGSSRSIGGASAVGLRADVLDELVRPWMGDGQAAFYRQIAQADERFTDEVQGLYESMQVPTLVVWGTADTWIPVERAEELVRLMPHSALQLIDGAGHLVQEDSPTRFVEVLSSWLSKQVGV